MRYQSGDILKGKFTGTIFHIDHYCGTSDEYKISYEGRKDTVPGVWAITGLILIGGPSFVAAQGVSSSKKDTEFKVGDRVKILNIDTSSIRQVIGREGEVVKLINGHPRYIASVKDSAGEIWSYRKEDLELIEEDKFEAGDVISIEDLRAVKRKMVSTDIYCQCSKPTTILNAAAGNTFSFCTTCKKEKI